MIFVTGHTRGARSVARLQEVGWGRMMVDRELRPYPGEPWGFDNGAFAAWQAGREWDEEAFLKRLGQVLCAESPPFLAVLPDRPAHPDSLAFSLMWWERLARHPLPWYLAVQDGMDPEEIRELCPFFAGLFLGGSNAFKATAPLWASVAHGCGRKFHYARAGTPRKLKLAQAAGADSADSAFFLFHSRRWMQFEHLWLHGDGQLALAGL